MVSKPFASRPKLPPKARKAGEEVLQRRSPRLDDWLAATTATHGGAAVVKHGDSPAWVDLAVLVQLASLWCGAHRQGLFFSCFVSLPVNSPKLAAVLLA